MVDQVKSEAAAEKTTSQGVQSETATAWTSGGAAFATMWLSSRPTPPTPEAFRELQALPVAQRNAVLTAMHEKFGNRFVAEQLAAAGQHGPLSESMNPTNKANGWEVVGGTVLGPVGGVGLPKATVDLVRARGTLVQKDVIQSIEKSYDYASDVYGPIWEDIQTNFGEYIVTIAGFMTVEVVAGMMLASGDPIAEIVGMCIEAAMLALSIKFAYDETGDMVKHARDWWQLASTASKDPATHDVQLKKAGRAFAELTVSMIKAGLAIQAGLSMGSKGIHTGGGAKLRPGEVGNVGEDAGVGAGAKKTPVEAPKVVADETKVPAAGNQEKPTVPVGASLEARASEVLAKHGGNVEAAAPELNALRLPQPKVIEVVESAMSRRGMKPNFVLRDGTLVFASIEKAGRIPVALVDPKGRIDFGAALLAIGHGHPTVSDVKTPRGVIKEPATPIGDAASGGKIEAADASKQGSGAKPPAEMSEDERLKDDKEGGASGKTVKPKTAREVEIIVAMADRGDLPRPLYRPHQVPKEVNVKAGLASDTVHSGDVTDGIGRDWDVKEPYSRDVLEAKIRASNPKTTLKPGAKLGGSFDLGETIAEIEESLRDKEGVILSIQRLNDVDKALLKAELLKAGLTGGKIKIYE